jgi:hypothetical protein
MLGYIKPSKKKDKEADLKKFDGPLEENIKK